MAACGSDFTVAVTEDGELLAWGDGRDGHLGLDAVLHSSSRRVRPGGPELFDNQRIRLAAAGWNHLAVVAEDGAVLHLRQRSTRPAGPRAAAAAADGVPQGVFAGSRVVMVL